MNVSVDSMLKMASEHVNYLQGYRRDTALLVYSLLKETKERHIEVTDLKERLDEYTSDNHRLTDAKKMVKVMGNRLTESESGKVRLEQIRKRKRKPLEECIIDSTKDRD